MKIIADQNIPYVIEAFSSLGNVETLPADHISVDAVQDASILLVRSVTPVNRDLLEDSNISFVATATIGVDHIDEDYLRTSGTGFSSAPGSNAQSVVEYVITAVALYAERESRPLESITLGVVGVGAIGTLLNRTAQKLGMRTVLCDPPRALYHPHAYTPLSDLLAQVDVVSLHVPLTYGGQWPTVGMVDELFLSSMPNGSLLINASRGATLRESALLAHAHRLSPYVLDVWPDEPLIPQSLLTCSAVATPHIAGYSFDGKVSGTAMIYRAACEYFNVTPHWDVAQAYQSLPPCIIDGTGKTLATILCEAYDIMGDDTRLRHIVHTENPIQYFMKLRKEYPLRYEFSHWSVTGVSNHTLQIQLRALGFNLSE